MYALSLYGSLVVVAVEVFYSEDVYCTAILVDSQPFRSRFQTNGVSDVYSIHAREEFD